MPRERKFYASNKQQKNEIAPLAEEMIQ